MKRKSILLTILFTCAFSMVSAETYQNISYTSFANRDLRFSHFYYCWGLDFTNSNLTGAIFTGGFAENNYTNANCYGATFSGEMSNRYSGSIAPTELFLTGANLQNASFVDAYNSNYGRIHGEFADLRGSVTRTPDMYIINVSHNTIDAIGYIHKFSMTSSADDFYIRKYTPATVGGATISAKFASDSAVSGDAILTLEQGAEVEVIDTAVLSFGAESTLAINMDINGTSAFSIGDNAGLTFEDGATIAVNLEGVFDSSLPYVFSILNWGDNSNVEGLLNLVKGDTLLLLINGVLFSGEWDCAITNNAFQISMNVPEPATYAAVFGALALALAVARRRR